LLTVHYGPWSPIPTETFRQYDLQYSFHCLEGGRSHHVSIPSSLSFIRLNELARELYPYYSSVYLEIKNPENEPLNVLTPGFSIKEEEQVDSIYMSLKVFLTDPHYVRYHQSLDKYTDQEVFTEASLIYSNMEGGLGVFSLYNVLVHEYTGKVDDILIE
jgi:hypothetical protein